MCLTNVLESLSLCEDSLYENRRITTRRSVKVRQTLRVKHGSKALIARRNKQGKIKLRLKTLQDSLAYKRKVLKHKYNPWKRKQKQKRAFRLGDKGFRA